jgi:hypothetical protein
MLLRRFFHSSVALTSAFAVAAAIGQARTERWSENFELPTQGAAPSPSARSATQQWSNDFQLPGATNAVPTTAQPAQKRDDNWSESYEVPVPQAIEAPATKSWLSEDVLQPPSGKSESGGNGGIALCRKGARVRVISAGKWYPATVLDGPDRMNTCLVTYDGFGSNFDEWVAGTRMRALDNEPAKQAAASSRGVTGVRTGKYSCYTLEAGQLNYTYTDVIIESGNRYSIGGKSGTYTMSADGSMRFTGPMSNATGRYSIKNTGKAQIDLVFNGDARASMSCS